MLYDNIKAIAKEKHVTISQIERDLKFARGSIQKMNKSAPNIYKARAIAERLDVTLDELVKGETDDELQPTSCDPSLDGAEPDQN